MAREYQGPGGLRLHLDEPYSPQMADQMSKGHLVPIDGDAPEQDSSEPPDPVEPAAASGKPTANSKVDDWRTYAVSLGMPEEDAAAATKKDCQEYVQVVEDANDGAQE